MRCFIQFVHLLDTDMVFGLPITADASRGVTHRPPFPQIQQFLADRIRSRLWHSVSSVCRLSVCDVLYCGETLRLSEKLFERADRVAPETTPYGTKEVMFLLRSVCLSSG